MSRSKEHRFQVAGKERENGWITVGVHAVGGGHGFQNPSPKKGGLWSWHSPAKRFSVGQLSSHKKMLFC